MTPKDIPLPEPIGYIYRTAPPCERWQFVKASPYLPSTAQPIYTADQVKRFIDVTCDAKEKKK